VNDTATKALSATERRVAAAKASADQLGERIERRARETRDDRLAADRERKRQAKALRRDLRPRTSDGIGPTPHPTEWHPLYKNNLWSGLIADIRSALLAAGPDARLACVGVNHGEANRTDAAGWARQVREMIRQINGLAGYSVRFVFMRLTPNADTAPETIAATAQFRRFEQELEDDPTLNFRQIDVDGVPKQPDVVHFTAPGVVTVGELREAACFGP
jgi:hypothetical protein